MIEVDARGLSCPLPVVKTKKTLEENPLDLVVVLVDNAVARDNVARLAGSQNRLIEVEEIEGCFRLTLSTRGSARG